MKFRKLLIAAMTVVSAACAAAGLSACSDASVDHSQMGYVEVVFHLEGGKYRNSTNPVINYYDFEEGTENLIYPLGEFSGSDPERTDYYLDGWYLDREEVDGRVYYENKWDFEADTVSDEGVELYAYWRPRVNYSYNLCFREEDGSVRVLATYDGKSEGEPFVDDLNYAQKYTPAGYTFLGTYEDENGDPWNEDFGHPGGDEDTAVNVFPVYVEGVFNVVRTANELQRAFNSGRGVYLMNDIDMEGEALGIGGGSEVNYDSEFRGNGFTVSDFTIAYNVSRLVSIPELDQEGNLLCISLFGNLQGAAISDVTFKDFTMTLDANYSRIRRVYVAPLCMTMKESTVSNVTFEGGVFTCESLTSRLTADDLLVPEDGGAYFVNQDGSTVTNVLCSYENRMPEYFAAQAE